MGNYNSDFDVRYATYTAMGGNAAVSAFDSVYDIDLAILDIIQEGGGGGEGMTFEQIKQKLKNNGVEEIKFNGDDASSAVLDYAKLAELEAKQDALVSGTNIKTINGQSVLGEGNIEIQGGGGSTKTFVLDDMSSDELVELYNELYAYKESLSELKDYRICKKYNRYYDHKLMCATSIVCTQEYGSTGIVFSFFACYNDGNYDKAYYAIYLQSDGSWSLGRVMTIPDANNVIRADQRVQTTGTSTENVMSQKAVTDAINAIPSGEPEAYIKDASVSGNTLTITKKDDTTVEFTPEGGGGSTKTFLLDDMSSDELVELYNELYAYKESISELKDYRICKKYSQYYNHKIMYASSIICTDSYIAFVFFACSNDGNYGTSYYAIYLNSDGSWSIGRQIGIPIGSEYIRTDKRVQTTGTSTENVMSQKAVTDAINAAAGGGDYLSVASLDEVTSPKEGTVAYVRSHNNTHTGKKIKFSAINTSESFGYIILTENSSNEERKLKFKYNGNTYYHNYDWDEQAANNIIYENKFGVWYSANGVNDFLHPKYIRFQVLEATPYWDQWGSPEAGFTIFVECDTNLYTVSYQVNGQEQPEGFNVEMEDYSIVEPINGRSYIYQDGDWTDYFKLYKIDEMDKSEIVNLVETIFDEGAVGYTFVWSADERILSSSNFVIKPYEYHITAFAVNGESYGPHFYCISVHSDGSWSTSEPGIEKYTDYVKYFSINSNGDIFDTGNLVYDGMCLLNCRYWNMDSSHIGVGWLINTEGEGGEEDLPLTRFNILTAAWGKKPYVDDDELKYQYTLSNTQSGFDEITAMVDMPNGDIYMGRWICGYSSAIAKYLGKEDDGIEMAKIGWKKMFDFN